MRILSFVNTERLDSRSRLALEFSRAARLAGHEAILTGLAIGAAPPKEATPLGLAADEARVPFRLLLRRTAIDPGLVGQMEALFRRFQPELFQSFDFTGEVAHRIARWRPAHWRAVFFGFDWTEPDSPRAHTPPPRGLIGRALRGLEVRALRLADYVIPVDDAARSALLAVRVKETRLGAPPPAGWSPEEFAQVLLEAGPAMAEGTPRP